MSAPVITMVEDGVGIIELNRPDKFNCLSLAAHEVIHAACEAFEADGSVRAILVRARGEHFCTGADLQEITETLGDPAALDRFIGFGHAAMMRLEASPLPVVVAVHGLCLAGGLELMLAADICFAGQGARFGDQHARFGLVPGWGASQRLPRAIGMRRALDLMYSARWMDADEAQRVGLVNYVVPDEELHGEAMKYCRELTKRSRVGLSEMKRLAREGADLPIAQSMKLECDAAVRYLQGNDAAEGIAAFRERRKPSFR